MASVVVSVAGAAADGDGAAADEGGPEAEDSPSTHTGLVVQTKAESGTLTSTLGAVGGGALAVIPSAKFPEAVAQLLELHANGEHPTEALVVVFQIESNSLGSLLAHESVRPAIEAHMTTLLELPVAIILLHPKRNANAFWNDAFVRSLLVGVTIKEKPPPPPPPPRPKWPPPHRAGVPHQLWNSVSKRKVLGGWLTREEAKTLKLTEEEADECMANMNLTMCTDFNFFFAPEHQGNCEKVTCNWCGTEVATRNGLKANAKTMPAKQRKKGSLTDGITHANMLRHARGCRQPATLARKGRLEMLRSELSLPAPEDGGKRIEEEEVG